MPCNDATARRGASGSTGTCAIGRWASNARGGILIPLSSSTSAPGASEAVARHLEASMLACPAKTMGELRGREAEQGRWRLRGAERIERILVVLPRSCRALGDWPPIAAETDPSP